MVPWGVVKLLWAAVGGWLLVDLAAAGVSWAARLGSPAEFLYGEAVVLDETRRLGLGGALYAPPTDLPLTVTAYTPLYYLLVGWLQAASGSTGFLPGRLLSVGAVLVSAAVLAWTVHRLAGRWWSGLLAAGLFLTQNLTVLLWGPAHRVDPLALGLSLMGLALATAGRGTLAAVPLALAVLTKQTYLAAPLCVALMLWPCRRCLVRFGLVFGGLVAGVFGVGQWLTGGWLLWHTVLANANPLDFTYFASLFGAFLQFNALPLLAAGALFWLPARGAERLWRLYFVVAGAEALATIGKLGASSNYWLELTAATAVLTGVLASRLGTSSAARAPLNATGLAGVTLASLLMGVPAYQATVAQALELHLEGAVGGIGGQLELAPLVAAEPGPVLTDDPGLVILAGKRVEFESVIFTILASQGVWDETPILEAIAARRFGLVVVQEPLDAPPRPLIAARWTARVRAALRASYAPAAQQAGYWLYRPG